jgi:hypothetical protein
MIEQRTEKLTYFTLGTLLTNTHPRKKKRPNALITARTEIKHSLLVPMKTTNLWR